MKKIVILLMAACLLLAGCLSSGTDPTGDPGAQATTTVPVPTTTAPVPTTTDPVPTVTEPAPTTTDPIPTTEPTNPELDAFNELFRQSLESRNPYFYAKGTEFSSPSELWLYTYCDSGFAGEHEITDEEWDEVSKLLADPENVPGDFMRLPKDKIEAELQKYFGISLTDLSDTSFSGLFYLECTDSYCFFQSGVHFATTGPFTDIHHNDDGTISLDYKRYDKEYVITLKPNGDGYLILSNVKAE